MELNEGIRNYYLRYLNEGGEASIGPYITWIYDTCQVREAERIRAALLQAVDHVIGEKGCGEGGIFCPHFEAGTSCAAVHRQHIISHQLWSLPYRSAEP